MCHQVESSIQKGGSFISSQNIPQDHQRVVPPYLELRRIELKSVKNKKRKLKKLIADIRENEKKS